MAALAWAWLLRRRVLESTAEGEGGPAALRITTGLDAWHRRQGRFVFTAVASVGAVLAVMAFGLGVLPRVVPFAFLSGAALSWLCSRLVTGLAAAAVARTAAAARESSGAAWRTLFRVATAAGLAVAGLGLLDLCAWFAVLFWLAPFLGMPCTPVEAALVLLCQAVGGSLHALLARTSGGLFAGSAGLAGDQLLRSEAGVPETDSRSPALAASQLGRLLSGSGAWVADLFESQSLAVAAAAVLGAAAFGGDRDGRGPAMQLAAAALPLVLAGLGALVSLGCLRAAATARGRSSSDLRRVLGRAALAAAVSLAVLAAAAVALLLPRESFGLWGAVVAGLIAGFVSGRCAEHGSLPTAGPARETADQADAGPAVFLLHGLASGMRAAWLPAAVTAAAALCAFHFAGGGRDLAAGFYGVALAASGMLAAVGVTAAAGACWPVAANARDSLPAGAARETMDGLAARGAELAASARGVAVSGAALAALAAVPAFLEALRAPLAAALPGGRPGDGTAALLAAFSLGPANPALAAGVLAGATAAFLVAAMLLRAAVRSAARMAQECRRQWRTIPGLAELKSGAEPDAPGCVLATEPEIRHRAVPVLLTALLLPPAVGALLGAAGAAGFTFGVMAAGALLALALSAAGWIWDSAGRGLEGGRTGAVRGSVQHHSAALGRLLGEPLRELAGPGLAGLAKLTAVLAVVTAGLTVKLTGTGSLLGRVAALLTGMIG